MEFAEPPGRLEQARTVACSGPLQESERPASIEIALATYNSAPFLPELLDSLFAQTCQAFTLLVSDDGSSDATLDIVADYQRRYPGRVRLLGSDARLGSPIANFERMRALEAHNGPATPLLVHTDLAVVGPRLEPLCPSSFLYQKIDPRRNGLSPLPMANTVSGCAAMVNRALYDRARPLPPKAVMHDHWLVLVAAVTSRISCIDESTILYRQHQGNSIGAVPWRATSIIDRVRQTLFQDSKRRVMERLSGQAQALLAECGDAMRLDQYRAVAALADLWLTSRWRRFPLLWRHGLLLNGIVRHIALFITVTGRFGLRPLAPAPVSAP